MSIVAVNQPFAIFLILLGPAMGSFMALLADRLPRGEPVGAVRSACRSCGAVLTPFELVPILGFLWLRGRCRACGAAIPQWLLYAEILGLGGGVLAVAAGGGPAEMALSALFLWLLLGLGLADLLWYRLPDPLTASLAVVALGMAAFGLGMASGPVASLAGAALGSGGALALRWGYRRLRGREGMGMGDVKMLVGLGAFTGPLALPNLLLLASCLAIAGAVLIRPKGGQGTIAASRPMPFGAAMALAAAVLWALAQAGHLSG